MIERTGTIRRSAGQRGQAMTEYVLAVVAVLGLFLLPVIPDPRSEQLVPLLYLFIDAFDIYINSFHAVIVLPVP